jgi:hypothetical protein
VREDDFPIANLNGPFITLRLKDAFKTCTRKFTKAAGQQDPPPYWMFYEVIKVVCSEFTHQTASQNHARVPSYSDYLNFRIQPVSDCSQGAMT